MGDYDALMGFGGGAQPATTNRGSAYGDLMAYGEQPQAAPQEQISPFETFTRNATNLFGAAPALAGAGQVLFGDKYGADTAAAQYRNARDAYKSRLEAGNEQNPKAAIAGKIGALVPETLVGGVAGKLVSGAAGLTGLAAKAAPLIAENPLAAATARGLAGGAAYGAAGGAGEALSSGQDVLPAAAKGAAVGGALGGALGAGGEKLAQALHGAPEAQAESLVRGAAEKALPKKQKAVASLLDEELGGAQGSKLSHQDAILEQTPALRKIRTQDAGKVQEGIDELHGATDAIEKTKAPLYEHVDKALGGGVEARTAVDMLRNKAAVQTEAPWKRVLEQKAKQLEDQWSTVDADIAAKHLRHYIPQGDQGARDELATLADRISPTTEAPGMENLRMLAGGSKRLQDKAAEIGTEWEAAAPGKSAGKQVTKRDLLDLLAGGNSRKNWADINPKAREIVESMPFRPSPGHKIPSRQLREALTISQTDAADALGTLHMTQNAKLKALSQEVLGLTMNRVLHKARGSGVPGINASIDAILAANKRQSTWLRLADAASHKADKLALGKVGLGSQALHGAQNLVSGAEAVHGLMRAATGDVGGAATHLGTALAVHAGPKVIRGAKNATTDLMSMLQQEAAKGNPRALRLLSVARAGRAGATAAGGVAGSMAATTAGAQQ